MDSNYTPIDIKKLEKKNNGINTVLLLIVTLTALVLAVLLFMLIQKKLTQNKDQTEMIPTVKPTAIPTITTPQEEMISPTVSTATPDLIQSTVTPEASPTSSINSE